MKPHHEAFNEQIEYLLREYRSGFIKTIPELMKLIQMVYGDFMDFHPDELPESRGLHGRHSNKSKSVAEKS